MIQRFLLDLRIARRGSRQRQELYHNFISARHCGRCPTRARGIPARRGRTEGSHSRRQGGGESPVKEETGDTRYLTTTVRFDNASGKMRIQEIHLGGTSTKLVLNESGAD